MKIAELLITISVASAITYAGVSHDMDRRLRAVTSQDQHEDVKEADQAAYAAFLKLKQEGILVGYPDGQFRGSRPATRYDMAVAAHAVYQNLSVKLDGLQERLKELEGNIQASPNVQGIKDSLDNLKAEFDLIRGLGPQVADVQRLAATIQGEIQVLNGTVNELKNDPFQAETTKTLLNHEGRITKLEKVRNGG